MSDIVDLAIDAIAEITALRAQVAALTAENRTLRNYGVTARGEALPIERDTLGRMVREAWVRWAQTQPSPKASWLVPYDDLDEADKEADRQIGEAICRWTIIHEAARRAFTPDTGEQPEPRETVDICAHVAKGSGKCLFATRNWSPACTPRRCIGCPDIPTETSSLPLKSHIESEKL